MNRPWTSQRRALPSTAHTAEEAHILSEMLDAIPHDRPGRDRFIRTIHASNASYRVHTTFGLLMREAFKQWYPDRLEALDPILLPLLNRSPLGTVSFPNATAFTVLLGAHAFPNLPIDEVGNAMIERAFVENRDFPIMRTMLLSCDHDWDQFIRDVRYWERLVWTIRTDMRVLSSREAEMTTDAGALSYMNQGFWRAFMKIFGREGHIELITAEPDEFVVRIRWR